VQCLISRPSDREERNLPVFDAYDRSSAAHVTDIRYRHHRSPIAIVPMPASFVRLSYRRGRYENDRRAARPPHAAKGGERIQLSM